MRYKSAAIFQILFVVFSSCDQEQKAILVEDFDQSVSELFNPAQVIEFEGNRILGNFNNHRLTLNLYDLSRHSQVTVSLDLYIHDSWDGNTTGVNGPDLWVMEVGKNARFFETIKSSFSNSSCNSEICLLQSFPEPFPFPNNPKTGRTRVLPGLCHLQGRADGTSVYRISYTFNHRNSRLYLSMFDTLIQSNSPTKRCDESWSIDNLMISIS